MGGIEGGNSYQPETHNPIKITKSNIGITGKKIDFIKSQEEEDRKSENITEKDLSEQIDNSEKENNNLKSVFDKTINEVINNYLNDLNSPEGINLSKEGIYNDVLDIFDGIANNLDPNNIYIKDLDIIKNNFLLPKEKGIKFINFAIKQILSNRKRNNSEQTESSFINNENIDEHLNIIKSIFGSLYDIGNVRSLEEINIYLKDLKKNSEIEKIFNNFPDLEKILFEIIPTIIKTIPKEQFIESLDGFLDGIKGDIIIFSDFVNGKIELNKEVINFSKLNIINKSSKFLRRLIDKNNTDTFSQKIPGLKFVSDNEMITELLNIINSEKVSKEDKYLITDKILEGLEFFSRTYINTAEADKYINNYINSLIGLISKISKNIPNEKLVSLINKIKKGSNNEPIKNDIDIDISIKELGKFVWQNKNELLTIGSKVFDKWFSSEDISINELIIELFRNDEITEKLNILGSKIVENLKKITKIDLTRYALEFRKQILDYNFENFKIAKENKINLTKLEGNLIKKLGGKIEKSVEKLIIGKLESQENNNLKKEEIIEVVLKDLKLFLRDNTKLIFEYSEELGFKVESEEDRKNILFLINNILDNPKFLNIVSKVIENIGKELKGKSDIIGELTNLIKESLNDNGKKILEGTEEETKDILIDTFYNEILGKKESVETLLNLFDDNFESANNINEETIVQASNIFKDYIDYKQLVKVLESVDLEKLVKDIKAGNLEETKQIGIDIFVSIKNKTGFINELLDIGIIKEVKNLKQDTQLVKSKENLKEKDINIGIDLLYTTLEGSSDDNMSETLNKILNKVGLGKLANINIFGKNLGESILIFLKSVKKEDLKLVLSKNNINLNKLLDGKLSESEKLKISSTFSINLIKIIDIKKFQSEYKNENLSSNEKLALNLADEFQEVLNEESSLVQSLISKGTDIYDIYNGKIDINNENIDKNAIKQYGEEVFDLFNKVIQKIDNKYLEENLEITTGNIKRSKIIDTFVISFISENKWFIVKSVFTLIFNDAGKILDDYFRNKESNRSNFGDTILGFVENNNTNNK